MEDITPEMTDGAACDIGDFGTKLLKVFSVAIQTPIYIATCAFL
jgi:hypothetical protein